MAPANQQYTLVGFTEDLDWHPLQFVKSLPRNKLCSACGLVRKTTANLPCGHVACHFCYEQCRTADGYACPIDGEICPEEDVGWIDFPAENLLKREVKCWNQRHGCPLMMTASEVHKHFHRECEYHRTTCPRCSAMVLCRDMGEHLRASCNAHAAPQAPDGEETLSDAVEKEISTVVRRVVQEQAGEMKALLERALRDNGVLNDSLMEVSQNMNSLREAVIQGITPVGHISEMTHRVLDGINTLHEALNSEIADTIKQNAEEFPRVRAAIESAKDDAEASAKRILEMTKKALAYADEFPRVGAASESVQEDAGASTKAILEMQRKALAYAEELPRVVRSAIESVKEDTGASTKTILEIQQKVLAHAEELSHVPAAIESVKEDAGASRKTILKILKKALAYAEELPRVRAAIESAKEDAGASTKAILEIQKKALAYAEKNERRCDFFVSGIASLEAKALKDGDADYYSPKVYLRGYKISPGVELRRDEDDVFLNLLLQLHRGEHDDVVQWPLEHKIKLTIRHPLKNEEKGIIRTTTRGHENFKKPTKSSNTALYFRNCFKLGDLKTGGYVRDDKLRVLVELL